MIVLQFHYRTIHYRRTSKLKESMVMNYPKLHTILTTSRNHYNLYNCSSICFKSNVIGLHRGLFFFIALWPLRLQMRLLQTYFDKILATNGKSSVLSLSGRFSRDVYFWSLIAITVIRLKVNLHGDIDTTWLSLSPYWEFNIQSWSQTI